MKRDRGESLRHAALLACGGLAVAAILGAQVPAPRQTADGDGDGWGSSPGYTTVMGYNLAPLDGARLVRRIGATYCEEGTVGHFGHEGAADLDLPDGASLSLLRFWAYDVDPVNWLTFGIVETCLAPGSPTPTTTLLGSADTFGSPGTYYGATPLVSHTVDHVACSYSVRVDFAPSGEFAIQDLQVQKIQVVWYRQVSPAPVAASFNDVPTDHPFFQFVEALAKSGITGGCGGGSYCPNQPLTRGQMAVFLAKGLGLAWP